MIVMWTSDIVCINGRCNECEWLRYTRADDCIMNTTINGYFISHYYAICYKIREILSYNIEEDELEEDIDRPMRCSI